MKRLEFDERIAEAIGTDVCLPAVGQGAVGVECRIDDAEIHDLLRPLNDDDSATRVAAERAANEGLGGGCHVPVAVFSELQHDQITLRALVGTVDGKRILRTRKTGHRADAVRIGVDAARDLLHQGAGEILEAVYGAQG